MEVEVFCGEIINWPPEVTVLSEAIVKALAYKLIVPLAEDEMFSFKATVPP